MLHRKMKYEKSNSEFQRSEVGNMKTTSFVFFKNYVIYLHAILQQIIFVHVPTFRNLSLSDWILQRKQDRTISQVCGIPQNIQLPFGVSVLCRNSGVNGVQGKQQAQKRKVG